MSALQDPQPTALTLYFQVHQPHRLRPFSFFDIGSEKTQSYFDDDENRRIVERVAEKCYVPATQILKRACEEQDGRFRCAFSISGTALDQFERWSPQTLQAFQDLAATGCVEFLAETSHHSLAGVQDEAEFRSQVRDHSRRIETLFGTRPTCFRNTELITSNRIAQMAEDMGFTSILAEGADRILDGRSPHQLYRPEGSDAIVALLRSYRLSDDIAFRFSDRAWSEWPLSIERFTEWLTSLPSQDAVVGLFMDFETFGEHQWADTGILDFLGQLPAAALASERFVFQTPSQVAAERNPVDNLDIPSPVSWADAERDLTAWLDNSMQRSAHQALYDLLEAAKRSAQPQILETWRQLSTSDHFYYMCTKFFSDGDVHKYFSPFASPHDAYITWMNVLGDFRRRLEPKASN